MAASITNDSYREGPAQKHEPRAEPAINRPRRGDTDRDASRVSALRHEKRARDFPSGGIDDRRNAGVRGARDRQAVFDGAEDVRDVMLLRRSGIEIPSV